LATLFFVAIMAGAGYYVFSYALQGGETVKVPNITMRPITEASLILAEQGLDIGKQTQVADKNVPKYYIIAQRPEAGKVVRAGRKIYLTVSAGTDSLTPPGLTGKTLQQATDEIYRSSFNIGNVARIENPAPRDTVLAQDPDPSQRVSSAARISLLVSDGQESSNAFIMPELVRRSIQDVAKVIEPLGLKPKPIYVEQPDQPVDIVLDQRPPAGTLVQKGDIVEYSVRASGSVAMPDVQRKTPELTYVVPASWAEREVRVDTVDRSGARSTIFPPKNQFVDGRPMRFASGSTIMIPKISFIDKVTIEIYLDGQLSKSYLFEGDAPPVITP
jgi:serine/threonine-protein kinase